MSYHILIAIITLHGGSVIEKELQNISPLKACESIRDDPSWLPRFQTEPIEGETGRVYTCREVVYGVQN